MHEEIGVTSCGVVLRAPGSFARGAGQRRGIAADPDEDDEMRALAAGKRVAGA